MNFPNIVLTTAGVQAILEALSGDDIVFSKIKIGDGTSPGTQPAIRALTDIVHPRFECGISGIDVAEGFATLAFNFDNAHIGDTGFYARELGVFMKDEDDNDILYGYTNAGQDCGYIKPYAEDSFIQTSFRVVVAVGDAENVTAIIAPAIGYVSEDDFNAHVEDYNNPHHVTKDQIGLENVVNEAPSNMEITFGTATNLDVLDTGSTVAEIAEKVNKMLTEWNSGGSGGGSPAELGFGYAVCTTAAATAAKTVDMTNYTIVKGGIVAIKFTNGNTAASPTLNIASQGAKAISYKGATLGSSDDANWVIGANDVVYMMYTGVEYVMLGVDTAVEKVKAANPRVRQTAMNTGYHDGALRLLLSTPTAGNNRPKFGGDGTAAAVGNGGVLQLSGDSVTGTNQVYDVQIAVSADGKVSARAETSNGWTEWKPLALADSATKSITRSGNTFTATRADGSTYTFSQTDTWNAMVGATASTDGLPGYVGATPPHDGYNTKFLRADGTWGIPIGTTYDPAKLGFGYGTCATATATTEKAVTLANYMLVTGGYVAVKFANAVPANATMNVNSKGAKAIYHNGAAITANIIVAGDTATFIYDGTRYHLVAVDKAPATVAETKTYLGIS